MCAPGTLDVGTLEDEVYEVRGGEGKGIGGVEVVYGTAAFT
jgi:hypothetical protein